MSVGAVELRQFSRPILDIYGWANQNTNSSSNEVQEHNCNRNDLAVKSLEQEDKMDLDWRFFLLIPVAVLCLAFSCISIRGVKRIDGDRLGFLTHIRAGSTFVCLCGLTQILLSLVLFILFCFNGMGRRIFIYLEIDKINIYTAKLTCVAGTLLPLCVLVLTYTESNLIQYMLISGLLTT